jgi:hypothetical protein
MLDRARCTSTRRPNISAPSKRRTAFGAVMMVLGVCF